MSESRNSLVIAAPAKLNLFLEILGKRPDGFHALETLMVAIDLFDTLELRPAAQLALECHPLGLPNGPDNLVWKAADALRRRANRPDLGAAIRLTKRIPAQAGLAGGSSDAASTIEGLNRVWGLNWPKEKLAEVAAEVGSDVAFFFEDYAGWATSRGEVVEPERSAKPFDFVLVNPPVGLATASVYKALAKQPNPPPPFPPREGGAEPKPSSGSPPRCGEGPGEGLRVSGDAVRAAFRAGDVTSLGRCLHNRLQAPAFGLAPLVESVYRRLADLNPAGVLMSGSGSAVFALCRDRADAVRTAAAYRAACPPGEPESRVRTVRSLHIDPV